MQALREYIQVQVFLMPLGAFRGAGLPLSWSGTQVTQEAGTEHDTPDLGPRCDTLTPQRGYVMR